MSKTLADEIDRLDLNAKSMAEMAELLGYTDPWGQLQFDNRAYASNLINFLNDNPDACAALVTWVLDHGYTREGMRPQSVEVESDEEEEEEDA
jgi:hypothetical protein